MSAALFKGSIRIVQRADTLRNDSWWSLRFYTKVLCVSEELLIVVVGVSAYAAPRRQGGHQTVLERTVWFV